MTSDLDGTPATGLTRHASCLHLGHCCWPLTPRRDDHVHLVTLRAHDPHWPHDTLIKLVILGVALSLAPEQGGASLDTLGHVVPLLPRSALGCSGCLLASLQFTAGRRVGARSGWVPFG